VIRPAAGKGNPRFGAPRRGSSPEEALELEGGPKERDWRGVGKRSALVAALRGEAGFGGSLGVDGRYGTERARTAASGSASCEAREMRGGLAGRWVWLGCLRSSAEPEEGGGTDESPPASPFSRGCAVLPLRIALRLRVVVV